MSIVRRIPKLGRFAGLGVLVVVVVVPVVLVCIVIWAKIRAELDPPLAMQHAAATEVTGFETVATSTANLDRLVVSKIFIGPAVDRPQDHIVAPGAAFREIGRPGRPGAEWLVHGDYPDDCRISVDRVIGGNALRTVVELSDAQRDSVARGEKLLLSMEFACGEG
ncbi:hypothetical protein ACWZHB_20080 [Nocardia sp. FBN12]|uniref:hypothetical protein n=1 Tax=Nocardia sp. FBN12 TaxID=3419766 RepID=UPI003CFDF76D